MKEKDVEESCSLGSLDSATTEDLSESTTTSTKTQDLSSSESSNKKKPNKKPIRGCSAFALGALIFILLLGAGFALNSFFGTVWFRRAWKIWTDYHHSASSHMSTSTMDNDDEPNPPSFGSSVHVFRDTQNMEDILQVLKTTEDAWNSEYQTYTSEHHFSTRRHALLFAPGVYRGLDWQVGYYVQVAGLGKLPDDVKFLDCRRGPFVNALNKNLNPNGSSLDTFWRSAEHFAVFPSESMQWAVSQAAPLRNVHVGGDLHLHDGAAYASGGHMANTVVDGQVYFGGQQQWLSRNVHFTQGANGGAWSLVFVGCTGSVPQATPGGDFSAAVTVEDPSLRLEKPYIALETDGERFQLRVPQVIKLVNEPFIGATMAGPLFGGHESVRDFSQVRVVKAEEQDVTGRIQQALDAGKDVVLEPGIFGLTRTLEIQRPGQVLLGLGYATLVAPPDGSPCVHVASRTANIRIAGIMLEASERTTESGHYASLLEWGEEGVTDPGNPYYPGGLFDVFFRVGGAGTVRDRSSIYLNSMMRLHSGNIIGDNLWLWRADHASLMPGEAPNYPNISPMFHQTEANEFRVEDTGLTVAGDNVTLFGLAVEHANGHQTSWHGQHGKVYFYQSEFPYDVNATFGDVGYRGYRIDDAVTHHKVFGAGVYSNFRNQVVKVAMAMQHPEERNENIMAQNSFIVHLDNHGIIESVINGQGGAAATQGRPVRVASN